MLMEHANIVILWLIVSILFYTLYRLIYNRYLNYALHGEKQRWKLPSIRKMVILYVLCSIIGFSIYAQNFYAGNVCQPVGSASLGRIDSKESYEKVFEEYMATKEEGEQVHVTYKDVESNARLVFSSNQKGNVFIALQLEKEVSTQAEEYFYISVQSQGLLTTSIVRNTGEMLGAYLLTTIPSENCSYFDVKITIYNMSTDTNLEPILIEKSIQVDKVVSL